MSADTRLTFRQLAVGDRFEFDHSQMSLCSGLAHGPWVKTGRSRYMRAEERNEKGAYSHKVGDCTVGVHRGEGCKA